MNESMRRAVFAIAVITMLASLLAACGDGDGNSSDASGCPTFTMDFSDGPDTAYFRTIRGSVENGLIACPHAIIESYPAGGDLDQAQVSENIASNFLTSIGDAVETKTRRTVDAPSPELEGKVNLILAEAAPLE